MDGARMVLKDAAPREKTRAEFRAGLSQNDRGSCFSRAALSLRLGGVWAKKKSQVPPSGARPSKTIGVSQAGQMRLGRSSDMGTGTSVSTPPC